MEKIAVILAGGKGTRLRPYTIALPKPLVPIGNKPILEIIIMQLAKQGFEKVIITVNHQADIIMAYFGDGSKWGISISYSLESKPLGTMGPLKLIKDLPDNFLVMNGDVLSDINYRQLLDYHEKHQNLFTISGYRRTQAVDYGVLETKDNILIDFKEKPQLNYLVSMGVYAVSKKVLESIPEDTFFGFDMLMYHFIQKKEAVEVLEYHGYWMDIGRPEDYQCAVEDVEAGRFLY